MITINPKKSLRTEIYLYFLLGSLAPALIILSIYSKKLHSNLHALIVQRSDLGREVANTDLEFLISNFKSSVLALSREDFLIELLEAGKEASNSLKLLVVHRKRTTMSDKIAIYNNDKDGSMLVSSEEGSLKKLGSDFLDLIESKKEKKEQVLTRFSVDKERGFRLDIYAPIVEPFYKYLQGVLHETIFIDRKFIEAIKQKTGLEVGLFNQEQAFMHTSSSFPVLDSSTFRDLIQTGKVTTQNTLFMEGIPYHTVLQPIFHEDGTVFGAIGVLASEKVIERNIRLLQKIFIIALLGIIVFSMGINYYSTNRIIKPIYSVIEALHRISERDLGCRIKVENQNEIGELARSLNSMAEDLEKTTVSKNYVDDIFRSMIDTLIVVDPHNIIKTVNRATCELLGFNEDELIGQPIEKIIEDKNFMGPKFKKLLDDGFLANHETVYKTKKKKNISMLCSGAIMKNQAREFEGMVIIANDITERKLTEEHLRHTDKLASLGQLASGVAHEVRTCLGGMMNYAIRISENLKNRDNETKQSQNLVQSISEHMAKHEYDKLAVLVEDLKPFFLTANKYEERLKRNTTGLNEMGKRGIKITTDLLSFSKKSPPKMTPVIIDGVIENTCRIVRKEFEKFNIKILFECGVDLPPVNMDEDQIIQVLLNLLINGKNAMNEGGTINIRTGLDPTKKYLEIFVSDTGCGISEEEMDKIFEPFYTTFASGTGLGLSISHRIIQDHKGAISAKSKVGEGSTFRIQLPLI